MVLERERGRGFRLRGRSGMGWGERAGKL